MLFRSKKTAGDDSHDWVTDATDLIEGVLDGVRDKAVVPLTTVARAIVYGLLIAFVGTAAAVAASVVFVRLLDVYLDNIPGVPENVWFAEFVAGATFVLAGMLLWSKRSPKRADDQR